MKLFNEDNHVLIHRIRQFIKLIHGILLNKFDYKVS